MVELAREFFRSAEGKEILGNATIYESAKDSSMYNKAIPLTEPGANEQPITVMSNPEGHEQPGAYGTSLDDVILGGSIDNQSSTEGQAFINGKEGYDTVVLNGSPDDYFITMPQSPIDYPRTDQAPWEGQSSLYGYSVHVLNVKTGDTTILTGVENIAFDPQSEINNPKSLTAGSSALEGMTQISINEAIAQAETNMTPEETERAKIAASSEAVNAAKDDPELGKGFISISDEEIEVRSNAITDKLAADGLDTSDSYKRPESAAPVSPQTLENAGVAVKPLTPGG